MGMSPNDYYNMLPKDFAAKIEGYSRRVYRESSDLRKAAFIIISPHIKDLPFERFCREFWSLPLDEFREEKYSRNVDPELWKQIKKQQGKNEFEKIVQQHNKSISNGRRSSNGRSDRRKDTRG